MNTGRAGLELLTMGVIALVTIGAVVVLVYWGGVGLVALWRWLVGLGRLRAIRLLPSPGISSITQPERATTTSAEAPLVDKGNVSPDPKPPAGNAPSPVFGDATAGRDRHLRARRRRIPAAPEEVLGLCEACGHHRRRVHEEEPNRFLIASREQELIWVCRRCGRMNSAINEGKAICCTSDTCGRDEQDSEIRALSAEEVTREAVEELLEMANEREDAAHG
jgi:transposase InsO family protein